MKSRLSQSGYSLVELLVYIGLFVLISMVLVQSLISVVRTYAQAARYRALQTSGELTMERIVREVRSANTLTASGCATTLGSLTIVDNSGETTIVTVSDGRMQLSANGGAPEALSSSEVVVEEFIVCPITTPVGMGVKSTLTLTTTGNNPVRATFSSTIGIRK